MTSPDALMVAANLLEEVELTPAATEKLEQEAYWMLQAGVRISMAEYTSLSPSSTAALQRAQERVDRERADRVVEALEARIQELQQPAEEEASQQACDALAGVLKK